MSKITFESHEIHIKECKVSKDNCEANVVKVLASLEVLQSISDNQRFTVSDPSIRDYLKATDLVTENEDHTLCCDAAQRSRCLNMADVISDYIDDTIRAFHRDHPNGTINAID